MYGSFFLETLIGVCIGRLKKLGTSGQRQQQRLELLKIRNISSFLILFRLQTYWLEPLISGLDHYLSDCWPTCQSCTDMQNYVLLICWMCLIQSSLCNMINAHSLPLANFTTRHISLNYSSCPNVIASLYLSLT